MKADLLQRRVNELKSVTLPYPGQGKTADRHRRLFETGREDLSLAKLMEAHWDAGAILFEAGRTNTPNALYAVWASEAPQQALRMETSASGLRIFGKKPFCSGLGLVDRALVTVTVPEHRLIEIDLRSDPAGYSVDTSGWNTNAFQLTNTGSIEFLGMHASLDSVIGPKSWYLERPGFWYGACGPAACWAGGAAGLLDFALDAKRQDPHTLVHIAGLSANIWAMQALLREAGDEIDSPESDPREAMIRAMKLRHLAEQASSDCLRRFTRAYGPYPISMNENIARRYQELDLYLRQWHAERDLEVLGNAIVSQGS
jgi:alkylation response protein AidB-like acyl-CoA dehydrogenase